jgi:carbonic anhydrase/acetyltransferase-like protein (isoleucine patch superfamily)
MAARCPSTFMRVVVARRGLAIRTAVDAESCPHVTGPPADLAAVEERLAALRARYPRACIDRYLAAVPTVASSALVAPSACLIGDVRVGEDAQIWYGAVLRADLNQIVVGRRSNLQDGTVVHLGDKDSTRIGEDVVVGHRAVLHGCAIEDACLIGMNATVLDGATIGQASIVGAGAVVPAGMQVPRNSLVLGLPAKITKIGALDKEEFIRALAAKYVRLAHNHLRG